MTSKLASTLILSGHWGDCKCEIYQHFVDDSIGFFAYLYLRRKVFMKIKEAPFSVRNSDAPDNKLVDTWVLAEVLKDIEDSTLEATEATIEHRSIHEPFFLSIFLNSPSF